MSYKLTLAPNKSQNEEYKLPCGRCHAETRHKVLQSVDVDGEDRDWEGGYFWSSDKYQIVQCQGCETVSFRKSHVDSEDYYVDEMSDEISHVQQVDIYPSRIAGRHQVNNAHWLPFEIGRIYNETHSALCSKLPILAGIGIRALVEAICKEQHASGKNLEEKIDNLVAMGVLTKDGADILHSLRILGNIATHEITPHSEDKLSAAMNVVEHLLNGVYILPRVAASLPKRK